MRRFAQNINLPLSERRGIINTGGLVASPFTGSASDAVLLFLAAGTVTGPTADIVETNSATLGTSVVITAPGVYEAKLYLQQVPAVTVVAGISQDVAAAGLTGDPSFAIAGFIDVQTKVTIAGQTAAAWSITSTIFVPPELEGGTTIRFHATDGAGGAPAVSLTQAAPYYSIQKINDLHA